MSKDLLFRFFMTLQSAKDSANIPNSNSFSNIFNVPQKIFLAKVLQLPTSCRRYFGEYDIKVNSRFCEPMFITKVKYLTVIVFVHSLSNSPLVFWRSWTCLKTWKHPLVDQPKLLPGHVKKSCFLTARSLMVSTFHS